MQDKPAPRICSVEGCGAKLRASNTIGRCRPHSYIPAAGDVCGADGCETVLRKDNTTGFCTPHKRAKNRPGPAPKRKFTARVYDDRTCPDCGEVFTPASANHERCPECQHRHRLDLRAEREGRNQRDTCSVDGCDAKLRTSNTTGRCSPHRYIPAEWGVCAVDGCDARLRKDNGTGYCEPHQSAQSRAPVGPHVERAAPKPAPKKPVYGPRDCWECGIEFTPNASGTRRCPPCQAERSRKNGQSSQKQRGLAAKAIPVVRVCRGCGIEFTRERTIGSPRAYCSDECRHQWLTQERRAERKVSPKCQVEGCPNPRRSRKAEWCETHYARNRQHGSPHTTVSRVPNLKCWHCGTAVARRVAFCSELCRRRDRLNAPCVRLACLVCDTQLPEDAMLGTKFCSVDCRRMESRARRYAISPRDLRVMLAETDRCQICGTPCPDLAVDHCHATLKVRGLLCGQCNVGIGMFADDPGRLQAAIDYLKAHLVANSLSGG